MTTSPLITIYVKHSKGCNTRDEFARRCDCRKWLRWIRDSQRFQVKANMRSWAEAEQVKRQHEDQLTGRTSPVTQPDRFLKGTPRRTKPT